MDKVRCNKCNYTVGLNHGIEIIKVRFTCPQCGTITVIEEIV